MQTRAAPGRRRGGGAAAAVLIALLVLTAVIGTIVLNRGNGSFCVQWVAGSGPSATRETPVVDPPNGHVAEQDGIPWRVQTPGRPWSMVLSPGYDRFEVRAGDSWPNDLLDGKIVKNRVELQGAPLHFGTTYWLAWSVRVPKATKISSAGQVVVGQLHASDDPKDISGRHPIIAFKLHGPDHFEIDSRADSARTSVSVGEPDIRYQGPALSRDVWHHIVVSMAFSRTGTGHLDVWLDGRQVVAAPHARIGYNDATPPYWKFGIYRPAYLGTAIVEYANMQLGTRSLSAQIAHPLPPRPLTEELATSGCSAAKSSPS